jgi:hypothetical protein
MQRFLLSVFFFAAVAYADEQNNPAFLMGIEICNHIMLKGKTCDGYSSKHTTLIDEHTGHHKERLQKEKSTAEQDLVS